MNNYVLIVFNLVYISDLRTKRVRRGSFEYQCMIFHGISMYVSKFYLYTLFVALDIGVIMMYTI